MLNDGWDALRPEERAAVDRRYEEVESLRELRRSAQMSQAKIAEFLKSSQPAVSKIEKADGYVFPYPTRAMLKRWATKFPKSAL